MQTGNLSGRAGLTIAGKRSVAHSWYLKGRSFIGAGLLLRKHGGDESVTLHLLCQGIEVTLKALLLYSDYDLFKPKMRRPLGHDLVLLAETAMKHFGFNHLSDARRSELAELNNFYSNQLLRYGSVVDLLIAPSTIPHSHVLKGMRTVFKLGDTFIIGSDSI